MRPASEALTLPVPVIPMCAANLDRATSEEFVPLTPDQDKLDLDARCSSGTPARLWRMVLKPPHSPLSAVTRQDHAFGSPVRAHDTVSIGIFVIRRARRRRPESASSSACGGAATTRSCARRSLAAATIFIAFVICRYVLDGAYTPPEIL